MSEEDKGQEDVDGEVLETQEMRGAEMSREKRKGGR